MMERIQRIGFVCNGNVTRSVMAQVFTNQLVNPDKLVAVSAGINDPISLERAIPITTYRAIEHLGYPPPVGHTPRSADQNFMSALDIIFPVGPNQGDILRQRFPHLSDRIHVLTEYSGLIHEPIIDPARVIRDAALPSSLRLFPLGLRVLLYNFKGSIHYQDTAAVGDFLVKTGLQIERHVFFALDHMISQGVISRSDIRVGNNKRATNHFRFKD